MSDDNCQATQEAFERSMKELVSILKDHDVSSKHIEEFRIRNHGSGYLSEHQGIRDVKELLEIGLLV